MQSLEHFINKVQDYVRILSYVQYIILLLCSEQPNIILCTLTQKRKVIISIQGHKKYIQSLTAVNILSTSYITDNNKIFNERLHLS